MKRARIKAVATVPVRRKAKESIADNSKEGNSPVVQNEVQFKQELISEPNLEPKVECKQEIVSNSVSIFLPDNAKNFIPESSEEPPTVRESVPENISESEPKCLSTSAPEPVAVSVQTVLPNRPDKTVHQAQSPSTAEPNSNEEHILPDHPSIAEASELNVHRNTENGGQEENNETDPVKTPTKPQHRNVEVTPSKSVSRSYFMRPTPRLDGGGRIRRNSVQGSGASASESEDDCRKSTATNRVRNDSVCSVQSTKDGTQNPKLNVGTKRRMVVSESARRLAEARREFLIKHENSVPERSKLTMYDLIYYNPTGAPMKSQSGGPKTIARKVSICSINEKEEEEAVDEPSEMPVPQVKVGPNGQLIIDEQSLVIDQSKGLESIDRSDIIVDDDTGGGFYRRRKKSKEWSKWEMMKFYKALNSVGTDFLLMQSIFPNRTRYELKQKYKKEEKMNPLLVEKALRYQEFDPEALEAELANVTESERLEAEEKQKQKEKDKELRNLNKGKKMGRCRLVTTSIEQSDQEIAIWDKPDTDEEAAQDMNIPIKKPRKRAGRKRKILLVGENSDEENTPNSDSEPEIYTPQPTRSGRASRKVRKLQAPDPTRFDNILRKKERTYSECSSVKSHISSSQALHAIADVIPDVESIEPGSLVILSKESSVEPGKTLMQVYVVSSNYDSSDPNSKQSMTPVDLSPELLETVTSRMKEVQPQPINPD